MKRIITSFCALVMAVLMLGSVGQKSFAEGNAPIAENLELKTYKNVSVGGLLSAFDAEGDVLKFEITTHPIKGEIELADNGSFIYTPAENKKGRDYFGYKAIDSEGNLSQEATVIIRIEKQKSDICYSDMKGRAEEFAAVELAEKGIFVGEKIGSDYCFFPEKDVSKAEFLAMSMLVSEKPMMNAVMNYAVREDKLPEWFEAYVCSTAIAGESINVNWFEAVEKYEAAAMLNNQLNITEVSYISYEDSIENDIAQACANLSACGIINKQSELFENLSRADAAQILCKSLQLKDNR